MTINEEQIVSVLYIDHKRQVCFKRIIPINIEFNNEGAWTLKCYDVDKRRQDNLLMDCIEKWEGKDSKLNHGPRLVRTPNSR